MNNFSIGQDNLRLCIKLCVKDDDPPKNEKNSLENLENIQKRFILHPNQVFIFKNNK